MRLITYLKGGTDANIYNELLIRNIFFLSKLKIKRTFANEVLKNYKSNSFNDLVRLFRSVGVSAKGYQANIYDLVGIKNLTILHDKGRLVLVNGVSKDFVNVLDLKKGWEKIETNYFNVSDPQKFIVLDAFYDVDLFTFLKSKIINNKLIVPLVASSILTICIILFFKSFFLTFLFLTGLSFSLLLTWETISEGNVLSFCNTSEYSDCQTVTKSKYGSVFNLKVSSISNIYFFFTSLLALFHTSSSILLLQLLTIAGALIAIYLFAIQSFILKIYCPLCLVVALINILIVSVMAIDSQGHLATGFDMNVLWRKYIPILTVSIVLNFMIETLFKLQTDKLRLSKQLQGYLKLFPFDQKLHDSRKLILPASNANEIYLGNILSKTRIDIFISAQCDKCQNALREAKLLTEICSDVKIVINFIPAKSKDSNEKVRHILNTRVKWGNNASVKMIEKYSKTGTLLRERNPQESQEVQNLRNYYKELASLNEIATVPVISVNGRFLERDYQISDIKYYICNL